MNTELDEDTLDLCRALCVRAGMLFEDVSAELIWTGKLGAEELRLLVRKGQDAARQASALLTAAGVVADEVSSHPHKQADGDAS